MRIDTLATMRTLEEAGMPTKQAEVLAKLIYQSGGGERRTKVENRLAKPDTSLVVWLHIKTALLTAGLVLHLVTLGLLVASIVLVSG